MLISIFSLIKICIAQYTSAYPISIVIGGARETVSVIIVFVIMFCIRGSVGLFFLSCFDSEGFSAPEFNSISGEITFLDTNNYVLEPPE